MSALTIVELAARRVLAVLSRIPQGAASCADAHAHALWLAIAVLETHIGRASDRAQARAVAARVLTASAAKFGDHAGDIGDVIASAGWRLDDLLTDHDTHVIAHASGLQIVFGDDLCTGTPDAPANAPASAAPQTVTAQ